MCCHAAKYSLVGLEAAIQGSSVNNYFKNLRVAMTCFLRSC